MKERGSKWLKFWDRYLGIPLVAFLGLWGRKRPLPKSVQRVALLKSAGIGDLVILSGIVQDLKGKEILLFTGRSNAEMGHLLEGVQVIPLPLSNPFASLREIRKYEVDVWIDCDPWPRINALLSYFSKSLYRIGFRTARQGRHWVYDCQVLHSFEQHELENYRALIRPLGIEGRHLPRVGIAPVSRKKEVLLHLFPGGSRAELKRWPDEKWQALIEHLIERGYEVALTGSRADYTKLKRFTRATNLAGSLSLRETAELLQRCSSLISVDTGIMHLAAALGVPVIGLHGPTSPSRWGALGERVISLTPDLSYKPCIQLGFESTCRNNRCMQSLTVEQVISAFEQITDEKDDEYSNFSGGKRDATLAPLAHTLP